MDWNYTAKTSKELVSIGDALFCGPEQKHIDEQVQMTRLLESLSQTPIPQYPLRVQYSGESGTPDFHIESGGRRIGVELSKVAVQDVEHARGLQQKVGLGTLSISSLYRKQPKPRTKAEVISEGFVTPACVFPVSIEEHTQIWLEAFKNELDDKSAVLLGGHFHHGDEDWLVLWDRIGTADYEVEQRIQSVQDTLAPCWKAGWYSRVFLQCNHFFWQAMFSPSESIRL